MNATELRKATKTRQKKPTTKETSPAARSLAFEQNVRRWMMAVSRMLADPVIQRGVAHGLALGEEDRRMREMMKSRR